MLKKIILFSSPLLIVAEILVFGWIAELMREPSDASVMMGIGLLCTDVMANYFLLRFIFKQFNQEKK
ncbi:MAG: hypothetical protein H7259_08980 [Cytophagales bacterium]|nr:hypothetical protein [Cytophaga sp.]